MLGCSLRIPVKLLYSQWTTPKIQSLYTMPSRSSISLYLQETKENDNFTNWVCVSFFSKRWKTLYGYRCNNVWMIWIDNSRCWCVCAVLLQLQAKLVRSTDVDSDNNRLKYHWLGCVYRAHPLYTPAPYFSKTMYFIRKYFLETIIMSET
jgi:hypothetical protein